MKSRSKRIPGPLIAAVVAVAAIALLLFLWLAMAIRVQDIVVVGNRQLTREAVAQQSGVQKGESFLQVTSGRLRQNLEKNRYIRFERFDFDYKGTLTLYITERQGQAVYNRSGYSYVIDEMGMVLECTGENYPTNVDGPQVIGLDISDRAVIAEGNVLPVLSQAQLEAMSAVLAELRNTNVISRVTYLRMDDLDYITCVTQEAASIILGNSDNLRVKLLIAREVLYDREKTGDLNGARIDVSSARNAHFIPAQLPTPTPMPTATPAPTPTPKIE